MLIPDCVYTFEQGTMRFHEVGPPPPESLERRTSQIVHRVHHRLVADGWRIEDEAQPSLDLEETDALDALRAASIRYRVALGPGAGCRTATLKDPSPVRPETMKPFAANQQGFSLNAAVACPAYRGDRDQRYLNPIVALQPTPLAPRADAAISTTTAVRSETMRNRPTSSIRRRRR